MTEKRLTESSRRATECVERFLLHVADALAEQWLEDHQLTSHDAQKGDHKLLATTNV
jgi:hypothetical protein